MPRSISGPDDAPWWHSTSEHGVPEIPFRNEGLFESFGMKNLRADCGVEFKSFIKAVSSTVSCAVCSCFLRGGRFSRVRFE